MIPGTSSRGRPRSLAAKEAVLRAAFTLLRDRGYAGFALEAVAGESGVAKSTIYRWWPDRASLATDAFFAATEVELTFPDTGLVRDNLRHQLHQLAAVLRGPAGEAMAAMIAGARTDPALGQALLHRWVLPRKRWGVEQLETARRTGECASDLNIDAALDVLYGPIYNRLMFGLGAPSPPQLDAYLAIVFEGLFLAP